jgi:hypothetical protein
MSDTTIKINWIESLDDAKAQSAESGKPIFLFLFAEG